MQVEGLIQVILYVADMDRAVQFYRVMLGLTVVQPAGVESYVNEQWVLLETGGAQLALHTGGAGELGADAPMVVFKVAEVEPLRNKLLAFGVAMEDSFSPAPGVTIANGRDPDGNRFTIKQLD
jgi:catechol 2,3-dioxygenase-like lactoylglutathione lyase family enzyme